MLLEKIHIDLIECGTDEAGRGCLAGPVTAAAVILPDGFSHAMMNDSKKLSRKHREHLRPLIEKEAIAYHVAHVMMEKIDEINILNASILAMHHAIKGLKVRPQHIAVDGNRFKEFEDIPATTVVKGDGKYLHIAAASILAKTYRDEYMSQLATQFPAYGWHHNQGYPTRAHREALRLHGITKYHRTTFRLLPDQMALDL